VEDLFKKLAASSKGLSAEEASKRLKEYGYNEITEKKIRPFLKFLTYFWGPIPWMIEIAGILSAVVHHWADFGIVVLMLLINAVVGFWQEYKADKNGKGNGDQDEDGDRRSCGHCQDDFRRSHLGRNIVPASSFLEHKDQRPQGIIDC